MDPADRDLLLQFLWTRDFEDHIDSPAKLRAWLPAGVRPVAESTGGIAIYTSHRGFGISPYQAVYFYADIEGFDSASGMKGSGSISPRSQFSASTTR